MNKNILVKNRLNSLYKRNLEAPAQRSAEWFSARNTAINASEIAACLKKTEEICQDYIQQFNIENFKIDNKCCSHFDTKEDFIINKCRAFFGEQVFVDTIFTLHGKKYEDIATRLYRKLFNKKILQYGSLQHSRLKWLRASPDGITSDGIMLEIKCPFKRKINNIVPFHYYLQIMTQLETCNLDECDYFECEISEFLSKNDFIASTSKLKGILINKISEPDNSESKYIYPPDSLDSTQDYLDWLNNFETDQLIEPIYYNIDKWNVIRVKHNKNWFHTWVKPELKKVHNFIISLQNNKELFLKYKTSIDLIKHKSYYDMYNKTICLINTDTEYTIHSDFSDVPDISYISD